jgi:hypothetical protein
MIWLYLFLLDFLILFLYDPDLQCVSLLLQNDASNSCTGGSVYQSASELLAFCYRMMRQIAAQEAVSTSLPLNCTPCSASYL